MANHLAGMILHTELGSGVQASTADQQWVQLIQSIREQAADGSLRELQDHMGLLRPPLLASSITSMPGFVVTGTVPFNLLAIVTFADHLCQQA